MAETDDIRAFLTQCFPFDHLEDALLDQLPSMIQTQQMAAGAHFPPEDPDKRHYLYIIRRGAVELIDENGEVIDRLGEGDIYSGQCQLISWRDRSGDRANEDTLLYLLPCQDLETLRTESREFDQHFTDSVRERLKRGIRGKLGSTSDLGHLNVEVGSLLHSDPVTTTWKSTIREAAQIMTKANASSIAITENGILVGLVTDRDMRKRCLAAGLNGDEPITEIMTMGLKTIPSDTLAIQALMQMTQNRFHHLPVVDDGRFVGMLSATDISRHQSTNAAFLATDIRRAESVDRLAELSARLPELQVNLAVAGVTAQHVGEAISSITDALTIRLLQMAEAEFGPAPVDYSWVAGGSQGRQEQSSHSDQDNALILSDDVQPEHMDYFAKLAQFVSDGLDACGFIYCPGDAMATNPQWCQPLKQWREYFADWIDNPEPKALMYLSIFFDLRHVYGAEELFDNLHRETVERCANSSLFIAYLASNALTHKPPLGFFRTFVLEKDGNKQDALDLKHRGIVPVTDIARVSALAKGLRPVNTVKRLRGAISAGSLSEEMGENLIDALEFIATLRVQHQAEQIQRGEKASNFLPPSELSKLEQAYLKDAFKVIKEMQEAMYSRYQLSRFG